MNRTVKGDWCRRTFGVLPLLTGAAGFCLWFSGLSASAQVDYEFPKLLIGNIYSSGSEPRQLLFRSERRAVRTGDTVRVTCDYTYPDSSVAARDHIVYEAGKLASFEEEELQTREKGSAHIRPDPRHPDRRIIEFQYTIGQGAQAKQSQRNEDLESDTLIDDMIPAFIESHWTALDQGSAARFRYIVLSRKETVGFKLIKDSETTWQNRPVLRIKMEPTSFIIAKLVDPLYFVVEKEGRHRILEYVGRTTPLIRSGNKWKDLDAVSVFDWR